MRPMQHSTSNDVLAAPTGVPADVCVPLPVTRLIYPDGSHAVASYWMPSESELALLRVGMPVRIIIGGRTHAPIHIGVDGDDVL